MEESIMNKILLIAIFSLFISTVATAKIQTQTITYNHKGVELKGYLAWNDTITKKRPGVKRPGVLVVHEWWGLNEYVRKRANQLARLGYIAFAADMYGKDKVTQHPSQASQWMEEITKNVKDWQERANEGLMILGNHELVDDKRIAAIGYCFGGATVLQLAYSGADIKGVVSFHGSLPVPSEEQASNTKAKILVAHGNADEFIHEEKIKEFRTTLDETGLDWQMIFYAQARHGFTNPYAKIYGIEQVQYNRKAAKRSWQHMQVFFKEIMSN